MERSEKESTRKSDKQLSQDGAAPKPSLRERNKRAKELLIRVAARRLFLAKGFDATTLREVADKADVGFGTVFAYANDKAGLLAMVFVEELKALPPLFPPNRQKGEVLDELVEGFSHLYHFWATIPSLSGHVLQQMEFYRGNPHMDTIIARRRQARDEVVDWLERLRGENRIGRGMAADQAADTLFAIYTSAVREWSASQQSDVAAGIERLRSLMELPVQALLPRS